VFGSNVPFGIFLPEERENASELGYTQFYVYVYSLPISNGDNLNYPCLSLKFYKFIKYLFFSKSSNKLIN
jgi:hypothetical protein